MTILQRLGRDALTAERIVQSREFIAATRLLLLARGNRANALSIAETERTGSRITEVLRTFTDPISISSTSGNLSPFTASANSFFASLQSVSAFDTLWPFMVHMAFRTKAVAITSTITGVSLSEQSVKPVSSVALSASDLEVSKAGAQIVVSEELIRAVDANAFLERQLRSAVAAATDAKFLALVTAGAPAIPSSGVTANGAILDIRALLQSITTGAESKLFLIVPPAIGKAWSVLGDASGGKTFPDAVYNGGSIGGVEIVVSDGASTQTIVLIDATGIAAAQERARLDTSVQASIQMDSAPDSPPLLSSPLTNLWQADLRALLVERFFAAKMVRPNSVATVVSANYSGSSP
jgi:hypothetical protein